MKKIIAVLLTVATAVTCAFALTACKKTEAKYSVGAQAGTTGELYLNGDEDMAFPGYKNIQGKGYDSIGQVTGYTTYEYGENAKLAKLKNFNPEGVLLTYTLLEYDDSGNEIKKERFDSEGVLLTRSAYEYDENGNIKNTKFTMPAE